MGTGFNNVVLLSRTVIPHENLKINGAFNDLSGGSIQGIEFIIVEDVWRPADGDIYHNLRDR